MPQEGFYYGENGVFGPCLIWKFDGKVDGGYVQVGGGKGYAKILSGNKNVLAHYLPNGKSSFGLPIGVDTNPEVVDSPSETKQHKFYVHLEGPCYDESRNYLTNADGSTVYGIYKIQATKRVAESLCTALKNAIAMDDPDLVDELDSGDDPDLVGDDKDVAPPRSPTSLGIALAGTTTSVLNMSQGQRHNVKAFQALLKTQRLDNLHKMVAKTRATDETTRKDAAVLIVADHLANNGGIKNNIALEVMKSDFRIDPITSYLRRKNIAPKGRNKHVIIEQAFFHFLEEAKNKSDE